VGGLEPIPAVIGREAGYTLDRSPVHHRAIQRQTRHNYAPINLKLMFLDRGRKPEYPQRTHACTGRTCKLAAKHEKAKQSLNKKEFKKKKVFKITENEQCSQL